MIERIRRFFRENLQEDDPDHHSDHALRLAAAALLFEVGRSDFELDDDERQVIEELVRSRFGLTNAELAALLQGAEERAHHAVSLHGFTSLLNDHWSVDDRAELVERMWRVVYADGRLDDHELHLMRKIASLLYVPHRRFIAGKLRARGDSG